MKKAKEYAEELIPVMKTNDKNATLLMVQDIIFKLLKDETVELFETRHCKTNDAFIAILKEQNNKFKAIVRLTNAKTEECEVALNPNAMKSYLMGKDEMKEFAQYI